jgi:hypothetical protein
MKASDQRAQTRYCTASDQPTKPPSGEWIQSLGDFPPLMAGFFMGGRMSGMLASDYDSLSDDEKDELDSIWEPVRGVLMECVDKYRFWFWDECSIKESGGRFVICHRGDPLPGTAARSQKVLSAIIGDVQLNYGR